MPVSETSLLSSSTTQSMNSLFYYRKVVDDYTYEAVTTPAKLPESADEAFAATIWSVQRTEDVGGFGTEFKTVRPIGNGKVSAGFHFPINAIENLNYYDAS